VIIETGGALVFYASLLKLLGGGQIIGIDGFSEVLAGLR